MREGPIHSQVRDGLGISTRTHIAKAIYTEKKAIFTNKSGRGFESEIVQGKTAAGRKSCVKAFTTYVFIYRAFGHPYLESRERQPIIRQQRLAGGISSRVLTYHLPLRVMTAHLFPSLSVSFSTFVENAMALIIPSPNFSFSTALYAYP